MASSTFISFTLPGRSSAPICCSHPRPNIPSWSHHQPTLQNTPLFPGLLQRRRQATAPARYHKGSTAVCRQEISLPSPLAAIALAVFCPRASKYLRPRTGRRSTRSRHHVVSGCAFRKKKGAGKADNPLGASLISSRTTQYPGGPLHSPSCQPGNVNAYDRVHTRPRVRQQLRIPATRHRLHARPHRCRGALPAPLLRRRNADRVPTHRTAASARRRTKSQPDFSCSPAPPRKAFVFAVSIVVGHRHRHRRRTEHPGVLSLRSRCSTRLRAA